MLLKQPIFIYLNFLPIQLSSQSCRGSNENSLHKSGLQVLESLLFVRGKEETEALNSLVAYMFFFCVGAHQHRWLIQQLNGPAKRQMFARYCPLFLFHGGISLLSIRGPRQLKNRRAHKAEEQGA